MNAVTNPAGRHYVDVIVVIPNPRAGESTEFKNELEVLTFNKTTGVNSREYYSDNAAAQLPSIPEFNNMRTLLQRNAVINVGEHQLLELHNNGQVDITEDFKRKFVDPDARDIQQQYEDTAHNETKTYILHSALTNFKKGIFTCPSTYNGEENPKYNNEGRIVRIAFELVNNNR